MRENKKSYYAIIPAEVRYDKALAPNAKLLYGEITALCNEKGFCWATNSYFAELYGVSIKTVSLWVKSLVDKKYITSQLIYKDGSKEIVNRYLQICSYPMEENVYTPTPKKVKDNNTSFNNTINNTINNTKSIDDGLIIDYLNQKTGAAYKTNTAKTVQLIKARMNEGFTVEDFKKVIDIKTAEWLKNPDMNKFLRPETLFGNKFESYLNQKVGGRDERANKDNKYAEGEEIAKRAGILSF